MREIPKSDHIANEWVHNINRQAILICFFLFIFRLEDLKTFEQDSKVQFVIDAVYSFAHALNALKRDVCPYWKGVCPAMNYYDGGDFYKNYLLKTDFIGKKKDHPTLTRKNMNLPYSIRMYWNNFWQLTVHVKFFFLKKLIQVESLYLCASFGTFCVHIGKLFESQ